MLVAVAFAGVARSADVTVERTEQGATVKVDGQLFTEYLIKSETKPILWPILGPTGKRMTREYPMHDVAAETKKDHPHQRSLWFLVGKADRPDGRRSTPGVPTDRIRKARRHRNAQRMAHPRRKEGLRGRTGDAF
jgi:hypothetical protein